MNFGESIALALGALRANKMRSFLTMLGIIIGVASVIAVMAISRGGQAMIIGEVQGLGSNLIWVQPKFEQGMGFQEIEFLKIGDEKAVLESCPDIQAVAIEDQTRMLVKSARETAQGTNIVGTTASFAEMRNVKIASGRFINTADEDGRNKVAVIGHDAAEKFFGGDDPIGQGLYVGGYKFIVVGVMEKMAQGMFVSDELDDGVVIIPITTYFRLSGQDRYPLMFIEVKSPEFSDKVADDVLRVLRMRHNGKEFMIMKLDQLIGSVKKITGILGGVIAGIAGISLLVGGIGIMNIMLVSVTERTREIGVRKAIGARRSDILGQFLVEAVVLSLIGGIIGIVVGWGLVVLVAKLAKLPSLLSWDAILIAVLFSVGVGIFFGIFPANKAAKLNPIEALRYE